MVSTVHTSNDASLFYILDAHSRISASSETESIQPEGGKDICIGESNYQMLRFAFEKAQKSGRQTQLLYESP